MTPILPYGNQGSKMLVISSARPSKGTGAPKF